MNNKITYNLVKKHNPDLPSWDELTKGQKQNIKQMYRYVFNQFKQYPHLYSGSIFLS